MPEINPFCNGAGLTNKEVKFKDFIELCKMEYDDENLNKNGGTN